MVQGQQQRRDTGVWLRCAELRGKVQGTCDPALGPPEYCCWQGYPDAMACAVLHDMHDKCAHVTR